MDVLNIHYTVFEENEELWKRLCLVEHKLWLVLCHMSVPLYSCDMGLACPWTQCWFCHPQIPPSYEQISLLNDRRMRRQEREDTCWHYEFINYYKWLLKYLNFFKKISSFSVIKTVVAGKVLWCTDSPLLYIVFVEGLIFVVNTWFCWSC